MSENELDGRIASLDEERIKARAAENEAMTVLRDISAKLRVLRQARVEIERRRRLAENPVPPVSPEVETIIQSVTATVQMAAAPPEEG